jgi:hypothetical protein
VYKKETTMTTQGTISTQAEEIAKLRGHDAHRIRRGASVVTAVAAATVTWLVLTNLANITLRVPGYGSGPSTSALSLGQVMITTLVAGLLGWGVLATLERFSRNAHRLWLRLAPLAAVASLLLPLTAPALTGTERLSLVVFHVVVASVLILSLGTTLAIGNRLPRR